MTSPKKEPAVAIQIRRNFRDVGVCLPRLRKLATTVCRRFGGRQDFGVYEISIAIVDDAEITKLNARFLGRRATTDCLSFDLSDARQQPALSEVEGTEVRSQTSDAGLRPSGFRPLTCELVVNGEMAVRQAALRGHSAEAELALYITHGLLHNFGFNDCTRHQARKMHDAEDTILQELGYGIVYNKNRGAQKR